MKRTASVLIMILMCVSTAMPYEANAMDAETDQNMEAAMAGTAETATVSQTEDEASAEITADTEDAAKQNQTKATTVKTYLKSTTRINVKWTKVSGATGYTVYRSTDKDGTYKKVKTVGSSKTSYLCKNLSKGTRYYFKVETRKKVSSSELYTAMSEVADRKTPSKLTKSSTGYSTTYASEIIDTAKKKIGAQYVYGAEGPNKFDCSGYVYWVYKKADVAGKTVNRTNAQGLYNKFKSYSVGKKYSKAQPGDIVLMSKGGKSSGVYHAAIYYGDNKLIHATNPRTDVRVTSTNWSGGSKNVAAIIRLPNL